MVTENVEEKGFLNTKGLSANHNIFSNMDYEGFVLMEERSAGSSVPPYLGYLIDSVLAETTRQLSLNRKISSTVIDVGSVVYGGSSFLPKAELEAAYRLFGCQFQTNWLASYALVYASGIAFSKVLAKANESANLANNVLKEKICDSEVNKGEVMGLLFPPQGYPVGARVRIFIPDEDLIAANEEARKWDFIRMETDAAARYFGGRVFRMEMVAEGPKGFVKGVVDLLFRKLKGFPSGSNLQSIRGMVDHYFDDRGKLSRSFLEAQRLKVPHLEDLAELRD